MAMPRLENFGQALMSGFGRLTDGPSMPGLMPDENQAATERHRMAMLAQMFQAAQPSRTPQSGLAALGQGIMAGQQAKDQYGAGAMQARAMFDENAIRKKLIEAQLAQARQPQERTEPADLRMLDALGLPRTLEGLADLVGVRGSANPMAEQLALIQAQLGIQQRQADMDRQRREDEVARKEQEGEARLKALRAAGGADRVARAWDALTVLGNSNVAKPGFGGDLRSRGSSMLALLGLEDEEVASAAEQFRDIATISGAELIKELGLDPTDTKFRAITQASLSLEKGDETNRLQLQRLAQAALGEVAAGRLTLDAKTEQKLREISEWKPSGGGGVVDLPAIYRMSIEELQSLDPKDMTPELLEAAINRYDELTNAR